jgi:hypothetical protein
VQIARRSPAPAGRTFPGHPLRVPGLRAGRDAHREHALGFRKSRARAGLAAHARHLAGTSAGLAFLARGKESRFLAEEALALATRASDKARGSALGAGASTIGAVAGAGESDFLLAAEHRLIEIKFQGVAQVVACRALAAGAKQIAEDGVEEIGDLGEVCLGAKGQVAGHAAKSVEVGTLGFVA